MAQFSRVTIALPKDLWEKVKYAVPSGQRSRLVAEALRAELRKRQKMEQFSKIHDLQDTMRQKYGELPSSAEDIEKMRQESDEERKGLR